MDGVRRDMQRQEQRRFENLYILEKQKELADKLRESEPKTELLAHKESH